MLNPIMLGYMLLALSQAFFAFNVVACKHLFETMPLYLVVGCRFLISTLIIAVAFKFTKTTLVDPKHPEGKLSKKDWVLVISQGFMAAFLFNFLFATGLQYSTATSAGIITSTLPAIIALSAVWLLKERLNAPKIISLFLAILGIIIINANHVSNDTTENLFLGNFLIFLSMFPEAWFSIISRKLGGRVSALGSALITNFIGTVTLLPLALIITPLDPSSFLWLSSWLNYGLLLVAGLSGVIFFWGWSYGLSVIPASTAANFGGIMPVMTTLLAICFLNEQLHWYHTVGMLLVLLSIAIGSNPDFWLRRRAKLTQA